MNSPIAIPRLLEDLTAEHSGAGLQQLRTCLLVVASDRV
jgi:hypothetical protein